MSGILVILACVLCYVFGFIMGHLVCKISNALASMEPAETYEDVIKRDG